MAVILVIWAYLWTFFSEGAEHPSSSPTGYYGLLTDSLLSGQFSLKVPPDPRLAELPNPWANYQGIPRMHDATYFHGRYYLYFGITPAVVLFAPWRIITGTFLSEGAGACIFGLMGFLLGLDVLSQLEQSRVYRLSDWLRALGVLVWGFGTFVFVIVQSPIFYTVPIASAFACLMAALCAIGRGVAQRSPTLAAGWLALASLAWGLAVGSRPNYILSLPAMLIPLAWCVARRPGQSTLLSRIPLAVAAVLPAAVVGAGLAWYNYSRFGSVLEFGIRYQFASSDQRFIKLWSTAFTGYNINGYLAADGLYLSHFPFFVQTGAMLGVVPWIPFTLLGIAFPATLLSRAARSSAVWVCIGTCALVAGFAHLFALCMLPFANDRYDVDFAPAWTLLALCVAMAALHQGAIVRPWARRLVASLICALALVGIVRGWMLVLDRTGDRYTRRIIAVASERLVSWIESVADKSYGPMRFSVNFQELAGGSKEALVETGGGRDGVFVERLDDDHLKLGFVHLGNPPIVGFPFPFKKGVSRSVQVDLGSFYPPDEHPFFNGWDKSMMEAVHRSIRVVVDGDVVLQGNSVFYPSDSLHVSVGRDAGLGFARFSGSISKSVIEPVRNFSQLQHQGWAGPVRLKLMFPEFGVAHSEPLISSGTSGASDMIYVTYLSPTTLRLGQDSSDGGNVETHTIKFDPSQEHTVDVSYDGLYHDSVSPTPGVILKFDGAWELKASRKTHPTKPYQVTFGFNAYRLSTASEAFSGTLQPLPIDSQAFTRKLIQRFGSINLGIQFVPMPPNISEPLLSIGIAGRGDVIFVHYETDDRVRIGIDHWGIGGALGKPVKIDYDHEYELQVSSATFLPPVGSPEWGGNSPAEQEHELQQIKVEMDGTVVASGPWRGYPSTVDKIVPGVNPNGASTCGPLFSGKIVDFDRASIKLSH
jgi:hypothetical protein